MAVYQGARLRTTPLPASRPAPGLERAAAPATASAATRMRPMGLLMATIVAATLLGLVYLTQTLGSNATTSEIESLQADQAALLTTINRNAIAVDERSDVDQVRTEARRLKLQKLGTPLVLSAP